MRQVNPRGVAATRVGVGGGLDVKWSIKHIELIAVRNGNTLLINSSTPIEDLSWDALSSVFRWVEDGGPDDGKDPALDINVCDGAVSAYKNVIVLATNEFEGVILCPISIRVLERDPQSWCGQVRANGLNVCHMVSIDRQEKFKEDTNQENTRPVQCAGTC